MKYKLNISFNCPKRNIKESVEDYSVVSIIINRNKGEPKAGLIVIKEDAEDEFKLNEVDIKVEQESTTSLNAVSKEEHEELLKELRITQKRNRELENAIKNISKIINKNLIEATEEVSLDNQIINTSVAGDEPIKEIKKRGRKPKIIQQNEQENEVTTE